MKKVETAFNVDGNHTHYVKLFPSEIPAVGERVLLQGGGKLLPDGWLEVTEVARTYDLDTGELTFVSVNVNYRK